MRLIATIVLVLALALPAMAADTKATYLTDSISPNSLTYDPVRMVIGNPDGTELVIDWSSGVFRFDGPMDESAKTFLKYLNDNYQLLKDNQCPRKALEQRWTNAEIVAQQAIIAAAQLRIELLRRGVHIQQLDAELEKNKKKGQVGDANTK